MPANSRAGVLAVDKPPGPTSHDVVAAARRALDIRRIGHTGTLDPFASGLLLLCIGAATRLAEYLLPLAKTYRAVIRFGTATTTDDPTGTVTARSECWRDLAPERIRATLGAHVGEHDQIPPAYSAKKVEGVRMYRRARAGDAAAAVPVRVRIHDIRVLRTDLPDVTAEIDCAAGTYIRALARDVGHALDCVAHLAELRRTRIGRYGVEGALSLEQLCDDAAVRNAWVAPLAALDHMPTVPVGDEDADALRHGRAVRAPNRPPTPGPPPSLPPLGGGVQRRASPETPDPLDAGTVAVAHDDRLLAIATLAHGRLEPRKVFPDA